MGRYRKWLVVPGLLLIALGLCTEESNAQRGGPPDPEAMWARMSQGKDSIDLNQNPFMKSMIERGGDPLPPNGILTKEQFVTGMQKKMAAGGGGFGKGGRGMGGPGMDGPQPTIIVNGAVVQPAPAMGGGGNTDFIASRFQQMDLNKDGFITMDEASDRMKATFPQIDKNGDGRIDLGEYTAYANERMAGGMGGGRGGPPNIGGDPNAQQFQFNPQQPGGFPGAPQFDASGGRGGRQNREEDDTTRVAVHRFGKLPKELPSWFEKLDTDKDGMVGLYEWRRGGEGPTSKFVEMDLNGDGYLTADEWIRYTKMSLEKKDDGESSGMRMTFGNGGGMPKGMNGQSGGTSGPTGGMSGSPKGFDGMQKGTGGSDDRSNKDDKRERKEKKGPKN